MVQAHERLTHPIMQSVLSYLGEDPALFDERLTATNFGFRLNYYPAMTDVPEGTTGRMLGHEDVDLFTILPAAETEGLAAPPPEDHEVGAGGRPAGHHRAEHRRLHAADHEQPAAVHHPPGELPPRSRRPQEAPHLVPDGDLRLGGRTPQGPAEPGRTVPLYPPVRAEDFHTRITSKYYGDSYHTTGEEGAVSRRIR